VYISGEGVALNPNTVIDASKGTGKTMLNIVNATGNGAKLVGSATANNLLTSNNSASVLVGGAGNDILRGGNGNDIISAGNGNNTVVTGTGINTVTLGNGINVVTGGTGVDTITVGTGSNYITAGGGLDVITLGAHTLGNVHVVDLSAVADMSDAGAAEVITINGFVSGVDKINLIAGANSVGTLTLAAGDGQVAMLGAITDTTSVATLANVYTALATATGLNGAAGHEFAVSASGAATIVARTVTYTTGAAAGTYLVINDNNANFQPATDIVIKLASGTVVAAGDIVVGQAAFSVTPIQAFTSTVGVDNFLGGDQADTFSAKFSSTGNNTGLDGTNTFQRAEVMNGGAGTDVLTISAALKATGMTLVAADFAGVTNIEELVLNNTSTSTGGGDIVATTNAIFNKVTANVSFVTGVNITTTTGVQTIVVNSGAAQIAAVGSGTVTAAVPGTGAITITSGAGADVISLGSTSVGFVHTGVATIVSTTGAAYTTALADTVTGFVVGTGKDILQIDLSDAGNVLFAGADADTEIAGNLVIRAIAKDAATTLAAGDEVLVITGTFANEAALRTSLGTTGVITKNDTEAASLLVIWNDGTNTHVSAVADAGVDATMTTADLTVVDLIVLTGVLTAFHTDNLVAVA